MESALLQTHALVMKAITSSQQVFVNLSVKVVAKMVTVLHLIPVLATGAIQNIITIVLQPVNLAAKTLFAQALIYAPVMMALQRTTLIHLGLSVFQNVLVVVSMGSV
jgi:hypothetical protein